MRPVESKLPGVGTTVFTIMSRLAEETGALNLSQGFPDFQPPEALLELVNQHLRSGHNQYPPMAGVVSLREQIEHKLVSLYGVTRDHVSEITVTSGATEALFCAIHAVVRAGDEVVVFDPAYDSYAPAVTLAGGTTRHLPLLPPEFSIDWERLRSVVSERTRLVIINSPHNPTGSILTSRDYDQLAAVLRPYDCYVLSDEVYEHIVFDGRSHETVIAHEELSERSFAVFSFGKTYHATGWKVGYCVARAELTAEFRRVHQFNTFTTTTPLQYALADFLARCPEHHLQLGSFYQEKRDFFTLAMRESGFKLRHSFGTYFQLADYGELSDLPDHEYAHWLTRNRGVAVIPVSAFYAEPPESRLIRFCFAKELDTLKQAAERLTGR
ncbi:MAG TPA: methionine aminotransferase [Gammaproteobacteria bacterium]|jgi:methionine aminotransferase